MLLRVADARYVEARNQVGRQACTGARRGDRSPPPLLEVLTLRYDGLYCFCFTGACHPVTRPRGSAECQINDGPFVTPPRPGGCVGLLHENTVCSQE